MHAIITSGQSKGADASADQVGDTGERTPEDCCAALGALFIFWYALRGGLRVHLWLENGTLSA